jgi:hypothetical protein
VDVASKPTLATFPGKELGIALYTTLSAKAEPAAKLTLSAAVTSAAKNMRRFFMRLLPL